MRKPRSLKTLHVSNAGVITRQENIASGNLGITLQYSPRIRNTHHAESHTVVGRLAEGPVLILSASRISPSQKFPASRNASLSTLADCGDGIKRQHRQQTEEPNATPS